ncbi:MAG: CPBP family intramembrane metalloprotease [Lachnospiraceae bacterium]|nr:CPBP family intramembrane metalloprotease [Lachnospiraceae bacterium]
MNYKIEKVNQMFLITVLVSLAASFLPISKLFPSTSARLVFSQVILAAPGAVYLIAGRQNYAKAVHLKKIRLSTFFWLILFTICVMPVMSFVNALSMLFVENSTVVTMSGVTTQNSWLLSMLLVAVIPGIFEESVYRGLFYQEYRKAAPVKGMLLSAFLFGIMHGNLNQFSYAFFMGIIFALVIEATDSILASMLMHFFINGSSITLLWLYPKLLEYAQKLYVQAQQSGDTATVNMLAGLVGEGGSGEDMMNQLLTETTTAETLLEIIKAYLPTALIFGVFAVVVYMVMAAGEGRLSYVKSLFRRNAKENTVAVPESDVEETLAEEKTVPSEVRLITKPLLAGILICVVLMFVYEFVPV